jgi:hypothetical protein
LLWSINVFQNFLIAWILVRILACGHHSKGDMANEQSRIVFSSAAEEFLSHLEYIFDDSFC